MFSLKKKPSQLNQIEHHISVNACTTEKVVKT